MKKLITVVLLVFAINAAYTQTNVPNGDFENWHNIVVNAQLNYDEIGTSNLDSWMGTLNSLASLPFTMGGPGPVTVFKSTDKHSGTYAAKAVSANFPLGVSTIFIPGMIGTAVMETAGVRALLGKPCPDCKPLHFKGYYKFQPVNNDSCAMVLLLSKWNTSAKKRDTIGFGKMVQHAAVTEYTQFDVPITYTGTAKIDTMTLLVVSSAGFNVINFMGSIGQVGNTMYVDDLSLDYPAGIQQILGQEVAVNLYPNPSSGVMNVELSKEVKNGTFDVYTAAGKIAGSYRVSQLKNTILLDNLASGVYYYRLMDGNQLLNTGGSFVINK